ncbi:hypothetical protein AB0N19_17875, partial [Streptomyces sp. NPDC051132]
MCGTRDSASVIRRPAGRAWSSGTWTEAHWSAGWPRSPQPFQRGSAGAAAVRAGASRASAVRAAAGQIVRVACPTQDDADALATIARKSQ